MFTVTAVGDWDAESLQQLQHDLPGHPIVRRHSAKKQQMEQHLPQMAPRPFPLMELPTELRLVVYEHLFRDNPADSNKTIIAPKRQPRTKNATSILLVSRQIAQEALPIFFKNATLTMNLDPQYHNGSEGWAYYLEHRLQPQKILGGDAYILQDFTNVHMHLDRAPPDSALDDPTRSWWSRAMPVFWAAVMTMACEDTQNMTISINIGDITTPSSPSRPYSFKRFAEQIGCMNRTFTDAAYRPPTKKEREHSRKTEAQKVADKEGQAILRFPPYARDILAVINALDNVGAWAVQTGQVLKLENSARTESRVVRGDRLVDFYSAAKGLVGEAGGDVWLVMEGKTKKGVAEARKMRPVLVEQATKKAEAQGLL